MTETKHLYGYGLVREDPLVRWYGASCTCGWKGKVLVNHRQSGDAAASNEWREHLAEVGACL